MEEKKILILGGNGKTGRKVTKRLTDLGKNFRIGSRRETPPFDWQNPETWPGALEGMDAAYITYQPDLAMPGASEVVSDFTAAAVKSGIQKMVLLTGRGEDKAEVSEQTVMNAGVDWTIVRASWFNQNFNEGFLLEPIVAGEVVLPECETADPMVDTDDIADVVVASLLDEKHNGQIYELTGPRLLTFEQATTEISKATGRDIRYKPVSMEDYHKMLAEHQVPEAFIWLINYLFTEVLDGRTSFLTNHTEKVLGRKPKDFSDYAKEIAASGIWNPAREPV